MKKVLMLPVLRHFLDVQNYSIVKKKYNIYWYISEEKYLKVMIKQEVAITAKDEDD